MILPREGDRAAAFMVCPSLTGYLNGAQAIILCINGARAVSQSFQVEHH